MPRGGLLAALLALVLLAGALRMHQLEAREMCHLEIFTPGIELPASSLGPPPRVTLAKTLTGSMWEPHPPLWYLAMLPWTRALGQDLTTVRLPSVLLGALSAALLGWLAALEAGALAGALAAAMLAMHGSHLYWSQVARPYVPAAALAIAASACLLSATRARRPTPWLLAYLALAAAGMATVYYFWIVFAVHMLWLAVAGMAGSGWSAPLLRWQVLLLLGMSPLVTLALFQSKESYLSADAAAFGVGLLQLSFHFETDVGSPPPLAPVLAAALALLGAILLVAGLARRARIEASANAVIAAPPRWTLLASALCACGVSFALAHLLGGHRAEKALLLRISALLPALLLVGFLAWERLVPALAARLAPRRTPSLISMVALLPIVALGAVSIFVPFFVERHMLIFAPFVLALMARGAVLLARRADGRIATLRAGALGAPLLFVLVAGARASLARPGAPVGYAELAAELRPRLQPGDRISVQPHFFISPLYFYLREQLPQLLEPGSEAQLTPATRLWLVRFEDRKLPPAQEALLAGRTCVERIDVRLLDAHLYVQDPPAMER